MPSLRKRIGFLPTEKVQIIIERICKENNLSHSKVTGILVEEALRARGALENVGTYEHNDAAQSEHFHPANKEFLTNDAKNNYKLSSKLFNS